MLNYRGGRGKKKKEEKKKRVGGGREGKPRIENAVERELKTDERLQ